MIGERVEVIERLELAAGKVIRWSRSLDGGWTWDEVKPIGERYPFVILNYQRGASDD